MESGTKNKTRESKIGTKALPECLMKTPKIQLKRKGYRLIRWEDSFLITFSGVQTGLEGLIQVAGEEEIMGLSLIYILNEFLIFSESSNANNAVGSILDATFMIEFGRVNAWSFLATFLRDDFNVMTRRVKSVLW
jgi:hypothetical protein